MFLLTRMANGDVLTPMAGQADAVLFLNTSNQWAYKDQAGAVTVMSGGGGSGGEDGADGVGITNIAKIAGDGSPGTTDTYRITLSDSSFYGFTVYNGADGADGEDGSGGGGGVALAELIAASGTTRTFATGDLGNIIVYDNAAVGTFTIPTDATLGSLGATVGVAIEVYQKGAGRVDIVAGSGVTLRKWSGYPSSAQYVTQTVVHVGANEWAVR